MLSGKRNELHLFNRDGEDLFYNIRYISKNSKSIVIISDDIPYWNLR